MRPLIPLLAAALAAVWGTATAHPVVAHAGDVPHEHPSGVVCVITCVTPHGRRLPCPSPEPCIDTYDTLTEAAAMPYATRDDLAARFGADEIDDLAPADDAGVSVRADAALADADAEIDAALAECYPVPLPAGAYPLLTSLACDLARARLYDDAAPKRVLKRAAAARARLGRIVAGELHVVAAHGTRVSRLPRILIDAGEPMATRDRLAGYLGPAPGAGAEWC